MHLQRRDFITALGGVAVAAPLLASCSRGDKPAGGHADTNGGGRSLRSRRR